MKKILIFDTTLRDGEQSPGVALNVHEKLEIARQLARLRVDIIEAGFPIASPGDAEAVKAVAREIKGPAICALARAREKDIEVAWESIRYAETPVIHTFIATSDIHLKHKLRLTRGLFSTRTDITCCKINPPFLVPQGASRQGTYPGEQKDTHFLLLRYDNQRVPGDFQCSVLC